MLHVAWVPVVQPSDLQADEVLFFDIAWVLVYVVFVFENVEVP